MWTDHARSAARTALLVGALIVGPGLQAAGIDAGTTIEGAAEARYSTAAGDRTIASNTVVVAVDELLDVTVTSLDSGSVAAHPGSATLSFELTNTGNGPEAFVLTANPIVDGNDFDTAIASIARDANGNGSYDPGVDELLTGPATTAELASDSKITLFVTVTVPADAADGETSAIDLRAEASTGTGPTGTVFAGKGLKGVDAVVGLSTTRATAEGSLTIGTASVTLIKSAAVSDPYGGTSAVPGSTIAYTIVASVIGTDGIDHLLVSDAFPAGTIYRAGSLKLDGVVLTDGPEDDAGETSDAGVSIALGSLPGGTSRSITFEVTIE